jgi:hypothetical protein
MSVYDGKLQWKTPAKSGRFEYDMPVSRQHEALGGKLTAYVNSEI